MHMRITRTRLGPAHRFSTFQTPNLCQSLPQDYLRTLNVRSDYLLIFSKIKLASLRSRRRQYPPDNPYLATSTTASSEAQGPASSAPSRSYSFPLFSRDQASSSAAPSGHALTEIATMTYRDRTAEFSSVVKSLQPFQSSQVRQRAPMRPSEVMLAAKQIGYDINYTCTKLEKLTELTRRRTLFSDPSNEIQELTQVIKQDLAKLNSDIADLQQRVKSKSGRENKHVRTHSSSVVVSLQSKLADISRDFKGVLELRTENLKQQKQRREQFSASPATSLSTPFGGGHSVLMQSDQPTRSSSVSIDMDSVQRDQQNQMQLVEQQDAYIQERAEAMENIHSTIVELGSIFKQLAEMVKEQEEQVIRIDRNVDEVQTNVEAAHTELLKYFKGITSNRWLMIKIFAVVVVFFIIFIVFLA